MLSRKMLFSACPAIRASVGYSLVSLRPDWSAYPFIVTPMTSTLVAPRCSAGLSGAIWRIEPSPKYSRLIAVAGKMNGIAAEASRCLISIRAGVPTRPVRRHGTISLSP